MNRDALVRGLEPGGDKVIVAVNGEQGIVLAEAETPVLILMDLTLQMIEGWEATRRLNAVPQSKTVPVIALNAHVMFGRHLGAGAMLLGRRVDAQRFYQQALDVATKIQHRPEIALTRLALADLKAAEGNYEAAREHLSFCIKELEAMKMAPALERARKLREALPAE